MLGWRSGMWEQKSRHHLPSWTAFREDPCVSAPCEQSQRTRGCLVGQGWACGPEWAAARDHLQLQSNGESAASRAQLALPPTQGLAILCPTLVKHHFVSASPLAFPVLLRAVLGVLISPFAMEGNVGPRQKKPSAQEARAFLRRPPSTTPNASPQSLLPWL